MQARQIVRTLTSRRALIIAGACMAAAMLAGIGVIIYVEAELPNIRSLADYHPKQTTKIYSNDGQLVGELYEERRTEVPIKDIPEQVIHAFLAAEDANFYHHEGIDYLGILRAFVKNLRPGAHLQGASTITQQTVKTMVTGPERSYIRKLREALLARRLEKMLSKNDILHLYLNQIYFGAGAYGVEEAAQTYFGKSVRDVDLGEAAYLAAIPKNPGHYTIIADPAAAKERQHYVLEQMLANGWATKAQVKAALDKPVPAPAQPPPYLDRTPYYVQEVKKLLVQRYGEQTVMTGGLTVYTGMNAVEQVEAQKALRGGLEDLARKHGWPGARLRIEVDRLQRYTEALHTAYDAAMKKRAAYVGEDDQQARRVWDLRAIGPKTLTDESLLAAAVQLKPLAVGQRVTGLVSSIDSAAKEAWVDLGCCYGRITLDSLQWARRFSPLSPTPAPRDPSEVLNKGDLVAVDLGSEATPPDTHRGEPVVPVQLVPIPKVNGAVVVIDPYNRYVQALVGGYRQKAGLLDRATQALRQPGSAFKPIVYATGLTERAITQASICPDSPVVIRDPWTGKAWKPENYEDGVYSGNITYRTALAESKNTCSVKLVEKVGPDKVIAMARAMGITSNLPENLTLALGTGEVRPIELANAYATIAAGGLFAPPIFIRKVVDAQGQILEDNRAQPTQVLDPADAFVLTTMMEAVIQDGTGMRANVLNRTLAGKTGTTSQSRSVWFGGFSPQVVSMVYVGFDDNSPMGRATGSSAALPIWIDFMGHALNGRPDRDFTPPDNVVFVQVDADTGRLSSAPNSIKMAFVDGTQPTEQSQKLPSIFDVDEEMSSDDPAAVGGP